MAFRTLLLISGVLFQGSYCVDKWMYEECELISIPECRALGAFNLTVYPNNPFDYELGDQTAEEARITFDGGFRGVLDFKNRCSRYLLPFICFTLAPLCVPGSVRPVVPCRPVCQKVRAECRNILIDLSIPYAERLDCSKLHEENTDSSRCIDMKDFNLMLTPSSVVSSEKPNTELTIVNCEENYVPVVGSHVGIFCAPDCGADTLFTKFEKDSAQIGMTVLAAATFFSTFLTILTFLINFSTRFQYPERPVFFMAVCYLIIAIVYFLRLIFGREFSCSSNSAGQTHLTLGGTNNPAMCTVQSLITYYFEEAAYLWWIIAACGWFLSASQGWSCEALQNYSRCFHFFVWGVPGLLTATIFLWKKIDTDELSGMCSVGNFDKTSLLVFVILPRIFYLFTGGCFTVASIIGSMRLRAKLRQNSADPSLTDKIDTLLWKFGLLCTLYVMTLASFLACGLVVVLSRKSYFDDMTIYSAARVTAAVSYARLILSPGMGIFIGGWICNAKSMQIWKEFLCRRFRKSSNKAKLLRVYSSEERMPLNKVDSPVFSPSVSAVPWLPSKK